MTFISKMFQINQGFNISLWEKGNFLKLLSDQQLALAHLAYRKTD